MNNALDEIQTDIKNIETEVINLMNVFEEKWGSDTLHMGLITRNNGSNSAYGKIVRADFYVKVRAQ